jgi:rod shape-determining protein MreC
MAILDIRERTGYLFIAVTLAHVILISAQVNTQRGVPLLEAVTFGVFAELQRGASMVVGGTQETWEDYFALQQVRSENEQLRQELSRLQVDLQQERAVSRQTQTLQQMLQLRGATPLETAAALVIGSGASPDFRTITIDKGTSDGLRPDMAVIAPAGVVGRIIMPSARAAKVQLLIDRNAAAGALIERTRVGAAEGVVEGTGGQLRMNYVSSAADVQVGDVVVTSGIDGIYPKGLRIGQIESVLRGAGQYSQIIVRPAVDFGSLEAVLVVTSAPVTVEE